MATQTPPKPYTSSLAREDQPKMLSRTSARRSYFSTSVGTKVLIATTGLLLFVYLVLHLAGNLLVFMGPVVFNSYAHFLISNPLVVPVEIGLLAIFLIHIYKALTNFIANRRARPRRYYRPVKRFFGWGWAGPPSRKSLASTTMHLSGLVILAFVIVHVAQMKYGPEYLFEQALVAQPEVHIRDLYRLEVEVFSNVLNVAFYMFCVVVVGIHLWHGVSSAFNSLGADHPRATPWVLRLGKVAAFAIGGGFLVIPLWVHLFGGR